VTLPPFQQLLDAYALDVHRFLLALVGPHEADDCYQETWLAALRAYPRLRDAANLRGWVLTIAHRKAIDHSRRRRAAALVAEVPERPELRSRAQTMSSGTTFAGCRPNSAQRSRCASSPMRATRRSPR
jgi:RNA polymerase sigma factor (sigma-70 family)